MTDDAEHQNNREEPALPPKLLEQFSVGDLPEGRDGLPPREEPFAAEGRRQPVDQTRETETLAPTTWNSRRTMLLAAGLGILAVILLMAAGALYLGRKTISQREKEAPPVAGKPAPVQAAPVDVTPEIPPPRFSPPPPPPDIPVPGAGESVRRKFALARMDKMLGNRISREENGLRPYIAKSAMAVIDPVFGLKDEELNTLSGRHRQVVAAYRGMFQQLGRNLGTRGDPDADAAYLASAHETADASLAAGRPMQIQKLVLCRSVSGYGKYELFADNEFNARHLPLIQVYTEIADLKYERREDGRYVYRLSEEIRLIRKTGESAEVKSDSAISITEITSSRKRDIYTAQYLHRQEKIESGEYMLEVRLRDQVSGETARATVPLRILADQMPRSR